MRGDHNGVLWRCSALRGVAEERRERSEAALEELRRAVAVHFAARQEEGCRASGESRCLEYEFSNGGKKGRKGKVGEVKYPLP